VSLQLFCSMSATFTLNFFRSGINFRQWGSFQLPGLLDFGEFKVNLQRVQNQNPLRLSVILEHVVSFFIVTHRLR